MAILCSGIYFELSYNRGICEFLNISYLWYGLTKIPDMVEKYSDIDYNYCF